MTWEQLSIFHHVRTSQVHACETCEVLGNGGKRQGYSVAGVVVSLRNLEGPQAEDIESTEHDECQVFSGAKPLTAARQLSCRAPRVRMPNGKLPPRIALQGCQI